MALASADSLPAEDSLPADAGAFSTLAADYRILAELARDDLGTVFLAEQLRVGARRIALRVLPPAVEWDPERLAEFERQIAAVARLRHASVLVVYECGRLPDGTAYVATELGDGETLAARLRRTGRLSVPDLLAVVEQCAHALDTAQGAGIEHRELSVDRIVLVAGVDGTLTSTLDQTPAVKLNDFGLAHGEDIHAPDREHGRGALGSGRLVRPDIVSLALVTRAMLTGRWPGAQAPEVADAAQPQAIPTALRTVLGRALDAAGGYSTAGEFAQALREVLTVPASAASESQEPSATPATATSRADSHGPVPVEGKTIFERPSGDVTSAPPPPWRARRSIGAGRGAPGVRGRGVPPPPWRTRRSSESPPLPAASILARPDSPVDVQSAGPPAAIPGKAEAHGKSLEACLMDCARAEVAPAQADQLSPILEEVGHLGGTGRTPEQPGDAGVSGGSDEDSPARTGQSRPAQRADEELAELQARYAALHAEHEASLQGLAEQRVLVARLRETLAVVQHLIQSVAPIAAEH